MRVTKKQLALALENLLKYIEPYKAEDYPQTCGACGTPNANCDMNCVDAAHMSAHDGAIHRAKQLLEGTR